MLATLLENAWGRDILVGFIATVSTVIVGFGLITPTGVRVSSLSRSIEGRAPKPEEAQQLQQLSQRVEKLSRINFVFIVIAIVAMVVQRFL